MSFTKFHPLALIGCRYEEDLERARTLGSNCFRLSLEWHRIEPAKGQIDQAAVQRYHDMFECMKR